MQDSGYYFFPVDFLQEMGGPTDTGSIFPVVGGARMITVINECS